MISDDNGGVWCLKRGGSRDLDNDWRRFLAQS